MGSPYRSLGEATANAADQEIAKARVKYKVMGRREIMGWVTLRRASRFLRGTIDAEVFFTGPQACAGQEWDPALLR